MLEHRFVVVKPDGWRRHQVVCVWSDRQVVVERFWSWDRADDLASRLNTLRDGFLRELGKQSP